MTHASCTSGYCRSSRHALLSRVRAVFKAVLHARGEIPTPSVRLPFLPASEASMQRAIAAQNRIRLTADATAPFVRRTFVRRTAPDRHKRNHVCLPTAAESLPLRPSECHCSWRARTVGVPGRTSESKRAESNGLYLSPSARRAEQTRPSPTRLCPFAAPMCPERLRPRGRARAGHIGDDGAGVLIEMVPSASPAARPQCPEFTAERRRRQT